MRRFIVVLAVALLCVAGMAAQAQHPTAGTQWNYTRDVKVMAGNDSFYVGAGAALGTDSTVFTITYATSGARTVFTNWLDISQLWVPDFLESYVDTTWLIHTNGVIDYDAPVGVSTHDSLTAFGSNTSYHSMPIGMRISAWHGSGAASTDTVGLSVHVSMDKIGYQVVWADHIEPGSGTSAQLLGDATTTKRHMAVPAGKLYGWKYMRLGVTGDGDHKAALACRLNHYYRVWAIPDNAQGDNWDMEAN